MLQAHALSAVFGSLNVARLTSLGVLPVSARLLEQAGGTRASPSWLHQHHPWTTPARHLAAAPDAAPPPLHEIMAVTPGFVAEPYSGPTTLPLTWPFFKEGRTMAWDKGRNWLSRGLALAWCRNHVPGWKYTDFKQQLADLYVQISRAYADGDLNGLEKVTTPHLFQQMRDEVLRRKAAGWHRVEFDFEDVPEMTAIKFVHGRFVQLSQKSPICFVQITAKVPSTQRFVAYSKAGEVVAGDPEAVVKVVDHWVFERKTQRPPKGQAVHDPPNSRWRLTQRLKLDR